MGYFRCLSREPGELGGQRQGRIEETLRCFFAEWGAEGIARLRAICCGMWNPYIDVIGEAAPHATIVFDRFHLVRNLLNAVNHVRKAEARELRKRNALPETLHSFA